MKRNIFIIVVLFALGVASCSNEELNTLLEGSDVTLSVLLTPKELNTKTFMPGEETIQRKVILVFKDNVCTGYSLGVDTVKTKSGIVKIVGIANPDDALVTTLNGGKGLTYTTLFAKITRQSFVSGSLIKVGVLNTTLEAATKPKLSIEVVHLPARVDMIVKLDGQTGDKFELQKYSVSGINVASNLMLEQTGMVQNTVKEYGIIENNVEVDAEHNKFSFYTYERSTAENDLVTIQIEGILTRVGKAPEGKKYKITLNPVKDLSKDSLTDGIVHGYIYELTGTINVRTGIDVVVKVRPWDTVEVPDVEFGGPNSDNNNREEL